MSWRRVGTGRDGNARATVLGAAFTVARGLGAGAAGFFVLMIFVPFPLGLMDVLGVAAFERALAGDRAGAFDRRPEATEAHFLDEGLLFFLEARAEVFPVERFFAVMPDPSAYQETRDYTYAARPGKAIRQPMTREQEFRARLRGAGWAMAALEPAVSSPADDGRQ